jgi:hypothetical protein
LDHTLEDAAYATTDEYVGRDGISWLERWAEQRKVSKRSEPAVPEWVERLAE